MIIIFKEVISFPAKLNTDSNTDTPCCITNLTLCESTP